MTFGNTREQATTTIAGAPFVYDPGAGNLLLDMLYSGPLIGDTPAQFDADGTGTMTRRVYGITSGFGYDNIALVTRFDAATTTAPEPGTWALLGVGLGGLGSVMARRRQGRMASLDGARSHAGDWRTGPYAGPRLRFGAARLPR